MDTFDLIGETLRRLRRERGLTLEKVGEMAGLGRGQLSRIETSKQEATLTTIGKILDCEGVSRREFFRRYDLVEAEAQAVEREKGDSAAAAAGAVRPPQDVRDLVGRFESFLQSTLDPSGAVAQGAIELGDFVVMFRVVPRGAPVPAAAPPTSPGGEEKPAKRGRRKRKEPVGE